MVNYIHKKNVEPVCHSFHDRKAFALPGLSKRATPKAPRRCLYIIRPSYLIINKIQLEHTYKTPLERSRCFVFDNP